MTLVWGHPEWLLGLGVVLAFVLLDRRAGRTWPGVGARALVLACIAVALAGPTLWVEAPEAVEVVVLDTSRSLPEAEQASAWQRAKEHLGASSGPVGLVTFGGTTHVAAVPGGPWPTDPPERSVTDGSDLSTALRVAAHLIPEDRAGTVRVLTDGRVAFPHDAAAELSHRGVRVQAESLDPGRPEPGLAGLEPAVDGVAPGATLEVSVVVHGGDLGVRGLLAVTLGGHELASTPVEVRRHERQVVSVSGSVPVWVAPGLAELAARLGDLRTARGVRVVPPPRVWVVGDRDAATRPLVRWLQADGIEVEAVAVSQLPDEVPEVQAIVLVDVPVERGHGAAALPASWRQGLDRHVRGGGGLVVVGGERAYDQGGWTDSELAELLPVSLEPHGRERDDAATVVLALDKSGSMALPTSGGTISHALASRLTGGAGTGTRFHQVQLAAMAAVRALRDTDSVGVLAVDSEARWVVPVTSAERELSVVRTIAQLTAAGGGIHVGAALEQGLAELRRADTPLRHMVLFADASDVDGTTGGRGGHVVDIVRLLARDQVTVSVIAIGPGDLPGLQILEQLALEGGGRFSHAERYEDLTALFVAETEQVLGQGIDEQSITVVPGRYHPALRGVSLQRAPALLGRNRVGLRDGTRVWATTEDGDPLLSSWRVGLGEVVAVATDLGGGWGRPWADWAGTPRLWTQTVRHVARQVDGDEGVALTTEADTVRVSLAGGDEPWVPGLRWHTAAEHGDEPLSLVAPGVWQAPDPIPAGTRGTLEITDPDGLVRASREIWRARTEDLWRTADLAAVASLAQDAVAPPPPSRSSALGPWVLALGLLLLPLDAALRRRRLAR